MTKIKKLVEHIEEEICGAKDYAEKYVEYKARGNTQWATKFKEMANDEIKHAGYLHDLTIQEIETLSKVYTPPVEMQKKWDEEHNEYVEKAAWVKQILTL